MSKPLIFEKIFGIEWASLPPVMQKHYAVRANSNDRVVVRGIMAVRRNRLMKLLSPVLHLFGALVPWDGEDIPVTVTFYSGPGSADFHFDRIFHLPGRKPFRFHSRLVQIRSDDVIELMRWGIGWRSRYRAQGSRITLSHIGYYWKIGTWLIPLPMLTWIMGRGAAEEEALTDNSFRMWMAVTHPLFGEAYRYEGIFDVAEVSRE